MNSDERRLIRKFFTSEVDRAIKLADETVPHVSNAVVAQNNIPAEAGAKTASAFERYLTARTALDTARERLAKEGWEFAIVGSTQMPGIRRTSAFQDQERRSRRATVEFRVQAIEDAARAALLEIISGENSAVAAALEALRTKLKALAEGRAR